MRRHIILTLGRSGSNWLAGALNQHPNVVNYGEVLGSYNKLAKLKALTRPTEPWSEYLDRVVSSRPVFYCGQAASAISHIKKRRPVNWHRHSSVTQVGFKEFATNFERFELMNYLEPRTDIHIISLQRENIFRRYISNEFLTKTDQVRADSTTDAQKETLRLDTNDMFDKLELFESELQIQSQLLKINNPVLTLTYEKLFDPNQTKTQLEDVYSFLGVNPIEVISGDSKLNSGELSDLIQNFDEVTSALSGTRFAQFLD